ncbi:MAG: ABC transporter ATP-binding protein [Proteobacteria bacterium]|nr:ABC transporter ATP-binding protein [Pseudomonadota bacterium]
MSAAPTLASAAPAIDFAQLTKRYGNKRALDRVDLQLGGAQQVGVVGPDGAGKTTLLRAIAGLLEVEAQRADVLGRDIRDDVRTLKERIGYVPQVFSLNRDLSVIENLRFTGRLHRIAKSDFERRAAELLERTALAPFTDRPTGALSGGMKQKLAVANALLPEPALLVLDECTAGVDVAARAEIAELLDARRGEALVLLSTSYLDEAAACDRLVYLDAGRVVATGTPAELRAQVRVELYRAWAAAPRSIAQAARALPYVVAVRASGRYARIDVSPERSPGATRVLADLAAIPGVRLVESLPLDMEATLLALARSHAQ